MLRKFLFVAALVLCTYQFIFHVQTYAFAQSAVEQTPVVSYEETEFNFGTVIQGTIVRHAFPIVNLGDAPLVITSVRASCGCTTATAANTQIAPHERGEVVAIFDTTGFDGFKEKTITVKTNDPQKAEKVLTVKGYVEGTLVINPPRIMYGEMPSTMLGNRSMRPVQISLKKLTDLRITALRASSDALRIENVRISNGSAAFDVGIDARVTPGALNERVFIETQRDSGEKNTFVLPVVAVVKPAITVTPRVLSFGLVEPKGAPLEESIRLQSETGEPFRLLRIAVEDGSPLSYRVQSSPDGLSYELAVRLDPKHLKRELREKILVKTSLDTQAEIQVDVYATMPPHV